LLPLQPGLPVQPTNCQPLAGCAVSRTHVPRTSISEHSEPQLVMPPVLLDTDPSPETTTVIFFRAQACSGELGQWANIVPQVREAVIATSTRG
jgi:hypothetical protein